MMRREGNLDFDLAPLRVGGWSVGDRVMMRSASGPTMLGSIRSFVTGDSGAMLAVVAVKPSGWLEAVPVPELARPTRDDQSAYRFREQDRLRARGVLCSFDPRAS